MYRRRSQLMPSLPDLAFLSQTHPIQILYSISYMINNMHICIRMYLAGNKRLFKESLYKIVCIESYEM